MSFIWLLAGLALLLSGYMLVLLRCSTGNRMHSVRPRLDTLITVRLRRLTRSPVHSQDLEALQHSAISLLEHLTKLNKILQSLPPLPASADAEPRLMDLARDVADSDHFDAPTLLRALTEDAAVVPDTLEIAAFPYLVASAHCQRFGAVLKIMSADEEERRAAKKTVRKLQSSQKKESLLDGAMLNSVGLAALMEELRTQQEDQLLAIVSDWLTSRGICTATLSLCYTNRQIRLAEEIRRTLACLEALDHMNWIAHCHQADQLHPLLLKDPSSVYPRMDYTSQLRLRSLITRLSQAAKIAAPDIVQNALLLSQSVDEQSPERYLGHWFQTPDGLCALHDTLGTKRGRLYFRLAQRQDELKHAFLWCFGIATGLLFLQVRQPVFMLPFFSLVMGSFSRRILLQHQPAELPGIKLDGQTSHIRTLVVLHAVIRDPHEAIRAVRHIKKLRQVFDEEEADFLLLSDFSPCMTAVSGADNAIIQAITTALEALGDDSRLMFLQRGRVWNSSMHLYCAPGGHSGALMDVCRLIARGEHTDPIVFSTSAPSAYERRYAYILSLSDDIQPASDMLQKMLQVIAHPRCQRHPGNGKPHGFSVLLPEETPLFMGAGLLRPDAFLEATDGMADPHDSLALCGFLAGQAQVRGAHILSTREDSPLALAYSRSIHAWQQLHWQLPWVKTPSGIVNNPLSRLDRFHMRELLRETLVPLGQFLLLIWATLTSCWPLFLIALIVPELHCVYSDKPLLQFYSQLSLLPSRLGMSLSAAVQLLRRKGDIPPDWTVLQLWLQLLAATLAGSLAFVSTGFVLPAFALCLLFSSFPLAQKHLASTDTPPAELDERRLSLLEDIAAASWQYFQAHVHEINHDLPPCSVQDNPAIGPEAATSPEAIGAYLFSCVCAKELGYLSAREAAARIDRTVTAAASLPMPFGLPCKRYALPALTVLDARSDAMSSGVLLTALLTAAQALRSWLPELPPSYTGLSASVHKLAESFQPSVLYDSEAGCFHAGLDDAGQGTGYVDVFSDGSLLLSVAACAMRCVPADHLLNLRRTYTRIGKFPVPLSRHGTASAHLLAGLLLPLDSQDALAFIRLMQARGSNGVFGQDTCRYAAVSPDMRYRQDVFGNPDNSLFPGKDAPVYAPHAAALCLPYAPAKAAEALERYQTLGALGAEGFCDAVDFTRETALVGLHDTFHQGITLMAVAHVLVNRSIRSYFCSLPEVELCLPLLQNRERRMILPPLPVRLPNRPSPGTHTQQVPLQQIPAGVHLIGSKEFLLMISSDGSCAAYDSGCPLTRTATPKPSPEGILFYLAAEGRVYRLASLQQPGTILFSPGEFQCEQTCGSLRTEMNCTADPVRKQVLHRITITNLSTRDRTLDLADILIPDLDASSQSLMPSRLDPQSLAVHVHGTDITLHHSFMTSLQPVNVSTCTDTVAFLGRSGTLHHPASMVEPPFDLVAASPDPCLSFRIRLSLPAREQVQLCFSTSLTTASAPNTKEFEDVCRLAALQHDALLEASGLSTRQAHMAIRLTGAIIAAGGHWSLSLTAVDPPDLLRDAISITSWFHLHGLDVQLMAECTAAQADSVQEMLSASAAKDSVHFITEGGRKPSHSKLLLHGNLPLEAQLDALYADLPLPDEDLRPAQPALLPRKKLLHAGTYGGFDPETMEYIIELEPGETTPSPWENHHISRYFRETVDESGFRSPFNEQVWLRLEDNTLLSPWSTELPRAIRINPNETSWEAWSEQLDIRLTSACMPGHHCALRLLKLRNASDAPITITICVLASLSPEATPMACEPGLIITAKETRTTQAYLAGEGWETRRINGEMLSVLTDRTGLHLPDSANGTTALLSCQLRLEPGASERCIWLAGNARSKSDAFHALAALHAENAASCLRRSRADWARQMTTLSVFTSEDTLTTLVNAILPAQVFCCTGVNAIPALAHFCPREAGRRLLDVARKAHTPDDWVVLTLIMADFIRITSRESIAHAHLPRRNDTVLGCCIKSVLSLPLDENNLPQGEQQARRCFLYALAADRLYQLSPDTALSSMHQKLLHAADTHLWQDNFYGPTLRLDIQTLACQAFGSTARTRQAMRTCWAVLYDQPHGLLRFQQPSESTILPGYPLNGGMITAQAVLALRALLSVSMNEEAFELLRALNPLHHTDDPLRQETFRCPPYRLHGSMQASPLEAGRAFPDGGDDAAALMYAVVLQDLLGLQREGDIIRVASHVPPEWDEYAITLQEGTSTWRISVERRISRITLDGEEIDGNHIRLHDDGKIHHVHFPLI